MILITIFNATDFTGRLATSAEVLRFKSVNTTLVWAVARLIFIPVFIVCVKPCWISWEWVQCLVMAVFGLSNGYLGSMALIQVHFFCISVLAKHILRIRLVSRDQASWQMLTRRRLAQ